MKKIKFIPISQEFEDLAELPKPIRSVVPSWYKNMSKSVYKDRGTLLPDFRPNMTIKTCVPFLDTMVSGYAITLPCDVEVVQESKYQNRVIWKSNWTPVTSHSMEQIPEKLVPDGYEKLPLKWENGWIIKVPKGYSVLFSHPFQRLDLPFYTIPGIVDCDQHNNAVNFPFLLKKDFIGIIEKGTPIAQFIPFKRETWNSEIEKYEDNKDFIKKNDNLYMSKISNFYRNSSWSRKEYN
jgi:hypothetical protein